MNERREGLLLLLPLVFLAVILIAAVARSEKGLDGTSWQLESLVVDGEMVPAIEGLSVTLTFDDGTVNGFGGCNNYFGNYTEDGQSLTIGELGSTLAICDDERGTSDQEFVYLSHLGVVDTFRLESNQLILSDGSTDLVILSAQDS